MTVPIASVAEVLGSFAVPRRGLRTRPGTFLLGSTGARLWADYLDPVPGFGGRLDMVHKLNIPLLFSVLTDALDDAGPWDGVWRPSYLEMTAVGTRGRLKELKFISWDDTAVSVQQWTNTSDVSLRLMLTVDAQWVVPGDAVGVPARGSRYVEKLGTEIRIVVDTDCPELWHGLDVAPGQTVSFVIAASVGLVDKDSDQTLLDRAGRHLDGGGLSAIERQQLDYDGWFAGAPSFASSDPVLDRTWAYRWFLLRHNMAEPALGPLHGPLFYEGRSHKMSKEPWHPDGWEFSKLIPLSSPLHLMDVRWHRDGTWGPALWRTLAAAQGDDGQFYSRTLDETFHPYANFLGWATWQYVLVHPESLEEASAFLSALKAQVRGELEHRVPDSDGLPVQVDHRLTGKEYQPSYWYFDGFPDDPSEQTTYTPVKRVDRAVYHLMNARGVAELCMMLNDPEVDEFLQVADHVAESIRTLQWDEDTCFFYDLHPKTGEKALVRNVVGFYPWWAGIAGPSHLEGLERAFDDDAFGSAHPVPSVSTDCPVYSPTGAWKGRYVKGRNGCSWNGPTWPYTNGIVIDAVAQASKAADHRFDHMVAWLLREYGLLHYRDRDGRSPYLVEHYDSSTGEPISDEPDYLHSSFIDLVVRCVGGLDVRGAALVVDPIDVGLHHFVLDGVPVAGHTVSVTYRRTPSDADVGRVGLSLIVDGELVAHSAHLGVLTCDLSARSI